MKNKHIVILAFSLVFLTCLVLSGCQTARTDISSIRGQSTDEFTLAAAEVPVMRLALGTPLDIPSAEISGLTWAGDWLILLPQYPSRFDNQIYRISHQDIENAIADNSITLSPQPIEFFSAGLEKEVPGFEGYEAITCNGQDAYLTIETHSAKTTGYIVHATWNDDYSELTVDTTSLTTIPSQMNISNSSYESILIFGKRVVTLYEANGLNINKQPMAQMFDLTLKNSQNINFPTLEYRVTDATQSDENGEFWVINYFFPGDRAKLNPANDELSKKYGVGSTHAQAETVERLVALQFSEDGIVLADKNPIQMQLLSGDESRNWEGIVRMDQKGFLLATDKFPETWLAFVAYP